MKKIKIVSLLVLVSVFFTGMIFSSCSDSVLDSDINSELDYRGGKNGKNGHKGNGNNNAGTSLDLCSCINDNYPFEELSGVEKSSLEKMREEEKLARDVYITMYAKWNLNVFNNISKSEQRHMDAILCLMEKYNIEDPAGDNPVGVFTDTDLQDLYNSLVSQGNQSLVDALTVGMTIEDLDIFDLMDLSESVDNKDILVVFNDLTKGSRNHMRAFYGQLEANGSNYTPQFITQVLFDSIIEGNHEKGGSICNDSGNKGGKHGKSHRGKGKKGKGRRG